MGEKLEIILPVELLERIDQFIDLLDFRSREDFILAAVRRLVDRYSIISMKEL